MPPSTKIALTVCILWCLAPLFALAGQATVARAVSEGRYNKAHSLGDGYHFDPRNGWESANVTDLQYKYRRDISQRRIPGERTGKKGMKESAKKGIGGAVGKLLEALKGLQGIGKPEPVTITWYTGHDLKNPSCWSDGRWAPTDASFVAALTEYGWMNKPKCFKFIELCNTPKKCVFARVVDTCAGCKVDSKHVDLTKAAFGELADFNEGTLTVQFRHATEPREWHEKLWGPRIERT